MMVMSLMIGLALYLLEKCHSFMTASAEPTLYHLHNVVKVKEKGGERFVLRVPEFYVNPGEMVAIIGPSGCGKSTLLDLLALITRATSADKFQIRLSDTNGPTSVLNLSEWGAADLRRKYLGYILQRGGLLPSLNCRENILLPWKLAGKPRPRKEIDSLISELDIIEQMGKKPAYLSGGQRQRVAIARALSHQPKLVFADEPTGSVDRPNAELIGQTLKDLAVQKNVGVVLVTHDIPLAEQYATRFYGFGELKKVRNQKTSTLLPC